MNFWHSDLARECCVEGDASGVTMSTREVGGHEVLHVQIRTEAAARAVGKPCGRYVTVTCLAPLNGLLADSAATARVIALSITNSRSLLKHMSIDSVMPSNHLILCHPLLLLPSIFPSITVFSNESVLCIRCPEY